MPVSIKEPKVFVDAVPVGTRTALKAAFRWRVTVLLA
jgi:hypothetical protein